MELLKGQEKQEKRHRLDHQAAALQEEQKETANITVKQILTYTSSLNGLFHNSEIYLTPRNFIHVFTKTDGILLFSRKLARRDA